MVKMLICTFSRKKCSATSAIIGATFRNTVTKPTDAYLRVSIEVAAKCIQGEACEAASAAMFTKIGATAESAAQLLRFTEHSREQRDAEDDPREGVFRRSEVERPEEHRA